MRCTGKTTRMLKDAIEQAEHGKAVYILSIDKIHSKGLEKMLSTMTDLTARELGIKFETVESLGNFDWKSLHLVGAHPNCTVLIDHYTIEREFSRMLEMLHRYDY